ncbi:MAG: BlaI/MecI/CopY family transcriptional regulator [Muribaculaceae bacterium]|nr:BlaI/MecI/CopY family transcriptional regulator [Muribaculaceae bacterium]
MKAGRPTVLLTIREEEIMQMLWEHGPMLVREMVKLYPDPKPHNNSVSTIVRILEQKGHVSHEDIGGGTYRYFAVTEKSNIRRKRLGDVIRNYFSSSYLSVVSELVKEEKISVDELRDLIDMVERGSEKK